MNTNRDTFKKIYIEITNICNLNCPFCYKSKKSKTMLTLDKFKLVLDKIKPYTKYIYLHVLGEPLIHPQVNEMINYAFENGFYVNITTNGYLINNLTTNKFRQINISLHSFNDIYNKSIEEYISNLLDFADKYSSNSYINFRLWANSIYKLDLVNYLEKHYNLVIKDNENIKLSNNVFLDFDHEFVWPDEKSDGSIDGVCYALKDHISILSDGTICACCLDADGVLSFGNIFNDNLDDIINSYKFIKLKEELKNGIRTNKLCKNCNFLK